MKNKKKGVPLQAKLKPCSSQTNNKLQNVAYVSAWNGVCLKPNFYLSIASYSNYTQTERAMEKREREIEKRRRLVHGDLRQRYKDIERNI